MTRSDGLRRKAARGLALSLLLFAVFAQAQGWEMRVCAGRSNLPYSNDDEEGFENRIAEVLAQELGAELRFVWLEVPDAQAFQSLLQRGECDVLMGAVEGNPNMITTLAYYRSSYVFVYRADAPFEVSTLDDEILKDLRIGVQAGAGGISPGVQALVSRGLIENQVLFLVEHEQPNPLREVVEAVSSGRVDVAIVWGPVAGYFASRQAGELELVPVSPRIDVPFVPFVASIGIGLRVGNEALRDDLNVAIARRWDDIQEILSRYRVPLEPLPEPRLESVGN